MSSYSMLIALILGPTVALADQSTPSPGDSELTEVTVTATKAPRALIDVPATVGVIDVERIERELSSDIKDLVRYEPGVSVRNAQSRFGLTDFNIRGIEGNRVLLEVDNVRLPDAFAIGSFSNATRDGVDVDLLKRVEIVRGSSSSLYGSNAIGGVVAFTTRDPADLLRDNAAFGGQVKLGYGEEDDGYVGSTAIAARNAAWSGLLAYTRRETGSLQNQGTNDALDASRTRANPQDSYTDSVLAKLLWEPEAGHTLRLTVEQSRTDVFADVISARTASAALTVLQLLGNDEQQRSRVGVEHEFRALGTRLFDSGEWRIYRQDSGTTQYTSEERRVTAGPVTSLRLRERVFEFDEEATGAEVTLRKTFSGARFEQTLTWGAELLNTDIAQQRDGYELNRSTGVRSGTVGTDVFPVRDTPLANVRQTAAYVQNEIRAGAWTFTPSVRVDRYELTPKPDAIFTADNPGIVPTELTDTSVSPRLGVLWRVTPKLAAFASYSAGFRAPPFNDVNVGFTNTLARYTSIPNPQLQPETSDNTELGLRIVDGANFLSVSVYYDTFDDFIESFSLIGTQPGTGFLVFQSRNLGEVAIYGVEIKGGWSFDEQLPGLALRAAASYGVGDDETADEPLNTIDPARAVVGFEYRPSGSRWGAELVATLVDHKRRVNQSAGELFAPPGFLTIDLLADLRISQRASVNVGVFNLTDRKYWEWADVRGRFATDPTLDFFTRPGRTLGAQVRVRW